MCTLYLCGVENLRLIGTYQAIEVSAVDGQRHLTFGEAAPRELTHGYQRRAGQPW